MTFAPVLPVALLAIVAVALLVVAVIALVRAGSAGVRASWALRILMVALFVVVASRPAIPGSTQGPSASGGLEVYFVVDTTSSVAAEDYDGTKPRLDGVKTDVAGIAAELIGAQYSLVTFDSSTVQRVPLTTDVTALESASSVITQEVTTYSHGSSVDEAVPFLTTLLKDAKKQNPGNRRVLFYLGDGEQTASTAAGSFATLAPYLDGGGVLGYGTRAGGRMLQFNGFDESQFGGTAPAPGYIQDYSQNPPADAISSIDEEELRTIARQLGVTYTHRTQPGDVSTLTAGIDVGRISVSPGRPGGPFELYWIFAIPLGLLVLAELVRLSGVLRELRPPRPPQSSKSPQEAS
jgi:Ca-activated chloride channel family protein